MKSSLRFFSLSTILFACLTTLAVESIDTPKPATDKLLFNGWGMTPTGTIVPLNNLAKLVPGNTAPDAPMVSDMPLRLILSPDGKSILAACGGYNRTGLAVLSLADKKVAKFFPLPEVFNGLAFSLDGKRVFVSSGDSKVLHIFKHDQGELSFEKSIKPAAPSEVAFLAGISVHPVTGKLYVCNEANHEVWIINPETLAFESAIRVETHPHSSVFGADKRHLYVSNWAAAVSA